MIENILLEILNNDPATMNITKGRHYFMVRPQGQRCASVVLQTVNNNHPQTLTGKSGYSKGTIQITCLAPDYETAKTLACTVREAVYNAAGNGATPNGQASIVCSDDHDIPSVPLAGNALPTFGVAIDAKFVFKD